MDYETGINWDSYEAEACRAEIAAKYAVRLQEQRDRVRVGRDTYPYVHQWNAYRKKAIYGKDYITSGGNTIKKLQDKPNITQRA